MLQGLDHIVILVDDLAAASADYRALGFSVVAGGEHADGTTHNALVAFADGSYLELLAFRQPAPDHRWWRHTVAGEGLIDFALLPDAIEHDVAAARSRGVSIAGPLDGGRLRPDGTRIAWQGAFPAAAELPFFCADVTPRELRVPGGVAHRHANGVRGIAEVQVAVNDLAASGARYAALLGCAPESGTTGARFPLGASAVTLHSAADGDERLRARLAQRGDGIYAIVLRGVAALDAALLHGVLVRQGSPRL